MSVYKTTIALLVCVTAVAGSPILPGDDQLQERGTIHAKREASGALLDGMDFADPTIIQLEDMTYAFATGANGKHIQAAFSTDFSDPFTWKSSDSDVFQAPPGWVENEEIWAPDAVQFTDFDSSFGMYYAGGTTNENGNRTHCLGLARSESVMGPYSDDSDQPWFVNQRMNGGCQEEQGGQIDPSIFRDADGSWYVVYKLDGPATCPGTYCDKTPIYLAKLAENEDGEVDGYTLDNSDHWPMRLMDNNGPADASNIEAPCIVMSKDGTYFLFFSRGQYYNGSYTVSYTYSTTGVEGPWNNSWQDLLVTNAPSARDTVGAAVASGVGAQPLDDAGSELLFAPGGADITLLGANMVFHADFGNQDGSVRALHTAQIEWLPDYKVGVV